MILGHTVEGVPIHINMGDGITTHNDDLEKATNDFVSIRGKIHRLDVTHMDYDKDTYKGKRKLYTAKGGKRMYPKNECQLEFEGAD